MILENLGKGIIIEPFIRRQLKTCSYDVRLGENYFRRHDAVETGDHIFNPYDEAAVRRHYGSPIQAGLACELPGYDKDPHLWHGIKPTHKVILLQPNEMILAHTEEFIGGTREPNGTRCFTTEMRARSSIGRVGFEVCRCAGWGDCGYTNRWTMEIVCTSPVPVPIVVGTRLAQIIFYEIDTIDWEDLYGADTSRDSYQGGVDIEAIKDAWRPEMLLPRLTTQ